MRKRTSIFFIVLSLTVTTVTGQSPFDPVDQSEYDVFAIALRQLTSDKETTLVVIDDKTNWSDLRQTDSALLFKELRSLKQETFQNFSIKNERKQKLTNQFKLKAKIKLIGEDEAALDTAQADPWESFHKRHRTAGAIFTLSRVGFDKEKSQALVYVAYFCGGLCGKGPVLSACKDWEFLECGEDF